MKDMNRILLAMGPKGKKFKESKSAFRFGDETFSSLGMITITLHTPRGVKTILVNFNVVRAIVPAPLGMGILD